MKVEFSYDPGDRSAGLQGGWDECSVLVPAPEITPEFRIVIGFEPGKGAEVQNWNVCYVGYTSGKKVIGDWDHGRTLSDFGPNVVNAVEQQWRAIEAQNKLESAGEDVWGAHMHRDDLIERHADDEALEAVHAEIREAEQNYERVKTETQAFLNAAEEMNEGSGPFA